MLCVGDRPANAKRIARQQSTTLQQGTEQKQPQSALHVESMGVSQPAVKLLLDAGETASDIPFLKGQISIATESWLDRATAKAKASMHEKSKDKAVWQ